MPHPHLLNRDQAERSLARFYETLGHSSSPRRDRQGARPSTALVIVGQSPTPEALPLPHSVRAHVAKTCQPGRSVVLAPDPSAERLGAAVRRWRQDEGRLSTGTEIVVRSSRLSGTSDRIDAIQAEITLGRICGFTALAIALWLGSGVAGAVVMGRL